MSRRPPSKVCRRALREAVRQIRRYGVDGPAPIEALEHLAARREQAVTLLDEELARARPQDLEALVHVARMLRLEELEPAVAAAVLQRPVPWAAKREAIEMLRRLGREIPAAVSAAMQQVKGFLEQPEQAGLEQILSLPVAWRRPAIEAWLESGPRDALLLERLLEAEPELLEPVIGALGRSGDPAALPVLQRLEAEGDRAHRKAVRRALHRLRSEGVAAAPPPATGDRFSLAIEPDVVHDSRAFVTGVDGSGGRILWLLTPSESGGERLLEAVLDDTAGVRRAEVLAVTRSGVREHVERLRENPAVLVAQIPPERAAAILRAAERITEQAGETLPEAYAAWREGPGRDLMAATAEGEGEGAPVETVDAERLAAAVELLARPYFAGWLVEHPAVEAAAEGVRVAETSQLALDDQQRKEQVDAAIRRSADAFDAAARERFRRRLHAVAEMLERLRRRQEAGWARAAADGFVAVEDLYSDHPFARALLQRSVLVAYERLPETVQAASPDRRIVAPDEAGP